MLKPTWKERNNEETKQFYYFLLLILNKQDLERSIGTGGNAVRGRVDDAMMRPNVSQLILEIEAEAGLRSAAWGLVRRRHLDRLFRSYYQNNIQHT